ncbi:MAG: hypothetical protein ACIAXF_05410 [Phycisphaerales bacterium JB063]
MRTRRLSRVCLPALALLLPMGCGESPAPEPASPAAPPASAEPTGPVVPEQGVVRIRVLSRETVPSLGAPEPMPMTTQEMYAAVHGGVLSLMSGEIDDDDWVCEALPGTDRVRFWVVRSETINEATAVTLADELALAFLAAAEARFADRVEVALLGVGKQLEAAVAQRTQVQQALRDYLELARSRAETPETRREQRELERDLHRINEHTGELQQLQDQLEAMQDAGQPWYRRVE